jgi:NADH:ubiquinone oxidoreductase subunit F (NADH-binding)
MPRALDILKKIETAGLVGRGGAAYPVAKKWTAVKEALRTKKIGYIIVNGSEGEPGVKKDGYLLNRYPEKILNGVLLADQFLGTKKIKKIYFFLNREYFKEFGPGLKKILAANKFRAIASKIEFFIKPEVLTYISGEETALLNLIEGKKVAPRLKPPYPTEHGLHGVPTLINNTETFYDISLVGRGKYQDHRFYTISGAIKHPGVYNLPVALSIDKILRKTDNYPVYKFFVQVGGDVSGEVLNSEQLSAPAEGAGSIMLYDEKRTDKDKLLKYWLKFYKEQSCGQCTICREGTYRLLELVNSARPNKKMIKEILEVLADSSFCALGYSLPVPVESYWHNILKI